MTANNGRTFDPSVIDMPFPIIDMPARAYSPGDSIHLPDGCDALFVGTARNGKELGDACDIMRQIAGARENRYIPRMSVQEVIDAGLWPGEGE